MKKEARRELETERSNPPVGTSKDHVICLKIDSQVICRLTDEEALEVSSLLKREVEAGASQR